MRDAAQAQAAILQRLQRLQRAGVRYVPQVPGLAEALIPEPVSPRPAVGSRPAGERAAPASRTSPPVAPHGGEPPGSGSSAVGSSAAETPRPAAAIELPADLTRPSLVAGDALPAVERPAALEILRQEVASCTRCSQLATMRTQTVFGVGNPSARLCFLGEAPGADEDRLGEPFVGRAGQLLTKIIEACTLSREEVYILNVLKCRPPGNRNPLPEEAAACRGYLDRQLEIIRPEFICCLGSIAARTLLETDRPIGKMRGMFHNYRGIPVLCTYHPAYLLRNPAAKKDTWQDMQLLMQRMGIDLTARR